MPTNGLKDIVLTNFQYITRVALASKNTSSGQLTTKYGRH